MPLVIEMVAARRALELGLVKGCQCDPCDIPDSDDEVLRAQLEAICKAACTEKCPDIGIEGGPICPLRQFEDESQEDYLRRCEAATQLAQVAAERENTDFDDIGD